MSQVRPVTYVSGLDMFAHFCCDRLLITTWHNRTRGRSGVSTIRCVSLQPFTSGGHMRLSKFLITVSAFGLLVSVAKAQEPTKEEASEASAGMKKVEATRHVPSGAKRTIYFLSGANPDCSPYEGIEVRKTKEPEHGTIEVVPSDGFPNFAKENARFKCNDKKIRGLKVNYKSSGDYVGPDGFVLFVMYPDGFAREINMHVSVH